jgi:hypothetical protein
VGRYHPILRVTETGLRCAGPSFDEERPRRLTGTVWGTTKRAYTLAADAHVTSRVGWPRPRAGPAWVAWGCVEGVVVGLLEAPGGKIPRARLYPNSTTL